MAHQNLAELLHRYFPFGFQTSRDSWARLGIGDLLARQDPLNEENRRYTVRRLATVYNQRPPDSRYPQVPVLAEQLLCLGLINDALRYILLRYTLHENPGVVPDSVEWARQRLGEDRIDRLPPTFAELFPPGPVLIEAVDLAHWLRTGEAELPVAHRVTIEAVLLYLMMRNPATRPFRDLFDDSELERRASYVPFVVCLEEFFASQPLLDLTGRTLFDTLRAPMLASPEDLGGQLAYIRTHWASLLPPSLLEHLDLVQDLLKEMDLARSPDYGPPPVLEFAHADWLYHEPAAFSPDADWMSNVVLIAKSTYVWLDQLSRRHGRHLRTLADIPDEELDRLARWGFSGLWLIGLWERSTASRKIKQYAGNPDAVASAYSLHDYAIAADLGGEEAYRDLRERARQRGIRLASDMVPNHMGIDSRWVIEHPHWFLQSNRPPYPAYRYDGGDLCDHADVEIRIEEGYWRRDDAAVVFERRDCRTGDVRYIYHGNDGTSMPWNDTAQLDFTQAEVREAVIQTILHVARQFPIIRFDAAMTLAKKHYQRLWFPAPGDAGAIPSRAEYGLSRERFHELFPQEFWREVVDRVATEVPQTLLLAEAFWLMEGYFVRTLGMHRVYNSAFMNMLKMEENQKYRQTVKNVLEFSPEVIKRFVNFMNNPDERTAVEQFGKGDKYFGVAVLMVTMPGLPMFGHGQVEGFAEKYGMEYKRAYWDEPVDEDMVRRHEREIFPLMRRRALFSGAENFAFFDFVTTDGQVDENVFAYTNRHGDERALILYNNVYQSTSGSIHTSTAINAAAVDRDPYLVRRGLAEALNLRTEPGVFYTFRDFVTGLEYLRSGEELVRHGLHATLGGYQFQTFLDWRELQDEDGRWRDLHARLQGRPVPSLRRSLREVELTPLLEELAAVGSESAWRDLQAGHVTALAASWSDLLATARSLNEDGPRPEPTQKELASELAAIAAVIADPSVTASRVDTAGRAAGAATKDEMGDDPVDPARDVLAMQNKAGGEYHRVGPGQPATDDRPAQRRTPEPSDAQHPERSVSAIASAGAALYLAWQQRQLTAALGVAVEPEPGADAEPPRGDHWRLRAEDLAILQDLARPTLNAVLPDDVDPDQVMAVADIVTRHGDLLGPRLRQSLRRLFTDHAARRFLQANHHEEVWYFNKERAEMLWDRAAIILPALGDITASSARASADKLKRLAAGAGYRQQELLASLEPAPASPRKKR